VIGYTVSRGSHKRRKDGLCAMEWVAYFAGEQHSASPACVDPALRLFNICLNDNLPDDLRQRLRPYLVRMIGTADDGRTQERLYMLADWGIRVAAPEGLEVAGRQKHAARLRAVEPVVDEATAKAAERVARAVGASAAANAPRAAVAHAAGVEDAVRAGDTVGSAATYAGDSVIAANYDPRDPVRRALWVKLLPSALDLLNQVLPTETVEIPEPIQGEYEELCR
jgi:hypothetical protein